MKLAARLPRIILLWERPASGGILGEYLCHLEHSQLLVLFTERVRRMHSVLEQSHRFLGVAVGPARPLDTYGVGGDARPPVWICEAQA